VSSVGVVDGKKCRDGNCRSTRGLNAKW
jgi:hypothetical protein